MNRSIFLIIFMMCFGRIYAQNTFYYQHDTPYSNTCRDVLELEDCYILCGENSKAGSFSDGFLMKIDKQGNFAWDKVIESEKIEDYRAIIDVNDGFMLGGYRWIDGKRRNLVKKFDYDGNEEWEKIVGDTLTLGRDNFVQDLLLIGDGVLMATSGFDTVSNTTNAFLIKLDLEANIIWQKNYGSDSTEQRVDLLESVELTEGGYLLKMEGQNMAWNFFPYIIKVDFEGNEIWRKDFRYYNSTTTNSDTLITFGDFCTYKNDHILAHFTRFDIDSYASSHILIEFDEAGNETEFIEYPPTGAVVRSDIYTNEDDEIFIIGQQDWDTVGNFYAEMYATKFDCNKNLLWENHYGTKNESESQFTGTLTSDGGVFIGGRIFNVSSPPVAFNSVLVKTDCRGELEWSKESCVDPNSTEDVILFPNPFQDYVNLHLPKATKVNEVKILIYDLEGRVIENFYFMNSNVMQLPMEYCARGVYLAIIFVDNVMYSSQKIIKY